MVNQPLLSYLKNVLQVETNLYICDQVISKHSSMLEECEKERNDIPTRFTKRYPPVRPQPPQLETVKKDPYPPKPELKNKYGKYLIYCIQTYGPFVGYVLFFALVGLVFLFHQLLDNIVYGAIAGVGSFVAFILLYTFLFYLRYLKKGVQKELDQWQMECNKVNDKYRNENARNERFMEIYRKDLEKYEQIVAAREEENRRNQAEIDRRTAAVNQREIELIASMEKFQEKREDIRATLDKLYEPGIVHPDYRSLIPVSMFVNYLEKERCYRLEGVSGAYNKYEDEIRAQTIINKLDDLTASFERFQKSMGTLYSSLYAAEGMITNLCSEVTRNRVAIESQTEAQKWNARLLADKTAALTSIGEANLREIEKMNQHFSDR